jgi:hypothetical protein
LSDVLAAWKAKARATVTLKSGTKVTVHLPDIQENIIAGSISMPALAIMSKLTEHPEESTSEDVAEARRLEWSLVMQMVDEVEGVGVDLTEDDMGSLPPEDREELTSYALRLKDLPRSNGSKRSKTPVEP